MKTHNVINSENTVLKIKNIKKTKTFAYDRYDDYYRYRSAEKDSIFVSVDFSVTSKNKEPKLPSLYLGYLSDDGKIMDASLLSIEFYRWSSHSHYLGLYFDSRNDFAHTDTINFSGVAEIPNDKKKYVLFTDSKEIYEFNSEMHRTPPLWYSAYDHIDSITLEEFADNYKLIKIIN